MKEQLAPWTPEWVESLITAHGEPGENPELERAADTPEQLRFARRVNALEAVLSGRPLVPGNKVSLLIDGPATHAAQLAEIARARHHVHLIVYILTDDSVGQKYLKLLSERAQAGVRVRVMFDAVGGRQAGEKFRQALEKAGIEIFEFGPTSPIESERMQISRRHHRKILVVDGRVAFTGGVNISDEYRSSPSKRKRSPAGWRDTHIRLDGPVVAEFQRMFFESWEQGRGSIEPSPDYWPALRNAGDDFVRAVLRNGQDVTDVLLHPLTARPQQDSGRKPRKSEHEIYASYLAAMSESRSRIWITQSYFIPNREFINVLGAAARRGVDVRVLVPGYTDIGLMLHASRYHYSDLLDAGIRLYEYSAPGSVLHAKTAVIDSVWATVGSSNLDYRSFIHNDEANAIILSHDFAREMERTFLDDLARSKEVTPKSWSDRPFRQRLLEDLAILLKYWI